MKSSFNIPTELWTLEEQLKAKQPYAVIIVNTTGVDDKTFAENYPTRVTVKEFTFNAEVGEYEESSFKFDKLVDCGKEARNFAITRANSEDEEGKKGYDAFEDAGIDKDEYIKGTKVLEQEAFKTEFERYLAALQDHKAMLITNGGTQFSIDYLKKIDCEKQLVEMRNNGKMIGSTPIAQQYRTAHDISAKISTLADVATMLSDKPIGKEQLKGADPKIRTINSLVVKDGIDAGLLKNDWEVFYKRQQADIAEDMSRKGRKEYENKTYAKKIESLYTQKDRNTGKPVIDVEKIKDRESDCDLSTLFKAIENAEGKKGVIFMQAATTGIVDDKPFPKNLGLPIQFSALVYDFDKGMISPNTLTDKISFNIKVNDTAIAEAKAVADNGGFNAFAYTGIDYDKYMNGDAYPISKAKERFKEFFEAHNPDDYIFVSNGRQKDGGLFTQHAISNIANFSWLRHPCIDFTQVIKEYCALCNEDFKTYEENVLLDPEKYTGTFSLEAIAKFNGIDNIDSTRAKCMFVSQAFAMIANQQKELFPERFEKSPSIEELAQQAPKKEDKPTGRTRPEFEDKIPEVNPEEQTAPESGSAPEQPKEATVNTPEQDAPKTEPITRPNRPSMAGRNVGMSKGMSDGKEMTNIVDVPDNAEKHGGLERFSNRPKRSLREQPPREGYSPASVPNVDINAMITALSQANAMNEKLIEQTKSLVEQNNALIEQNKANTARLNSLTDKLLDVMQEENAVFQRAFGVEQSEEMTYDRDDPDSVSKYLDGIKDNISQVKSDLSNEQAVKALNSANTALSKGQRILSDPEQNKNKESE